LPASLCSSPRGAAGDGDNNRRCCRRERRTSALRHPDPKWLLIKNPRCRLVAAEPSTSGRGLQRSPYRQVVHFRPFPPSSATRDRLQYGPPPSCGRISARPGGALHGDTVCPETCATSRSADPRGASTAGTGRRNRLAARRPRVKKKANVVFRGPLTGWVISLPRPDGRQSRTTMSRRGATISRSSAALTGSSTVELTRRLPPDA